MTTTQDMAVKGLFLSLTWSLFTARSTIRCGSRLMLALHRLQIVFINC